MCVCVCPQALTLSWTGNVANREFAAGKGWVVCLIPPYLCCYTGFPCSKSFPLDLSLLHADSRRKAWRSSWYSFTLSKLIHAHFQSPASKTCPGSFQDHSVLSLITSRLETSAFPGSIQPLPFFHLSVHLRLSEKEGFSWPLFQVCFLFISKWPQTTVIFYPFILLCYETSHQETTDACHVSSHSSDKYSWLQTASLA